MKQLVKEKDKKILQLEQEMLAEKHSINLHLQAQVTQFQKSVDQLKIQHRSKIGAKCYPG